MGELGDLLAVGVFRVGREGCAVGMLDPLIDRQYGQVTGSGEPAVVKQRLNAAKDAGWPVAQRPDLVHERRPRQVELRLDDSLALIAEKRLGIGAEDLLEPAASGRGR